MFLLPHLSTYRRPARWWTNCSIRSPNMWIQNKLKAPQKQAREARVKQRHCHIVITAGFPWRQSMFFPARIPQSIVGRSRVIGTTSNICIPRGASIFAAIMLYTWNLPQLQDSLKRLSGGGCLPLRIPHVKLLQALMFQSLLFSWAISLVLHHGLPSVHLCEQLFRINMMYSLVQSPIQRTNSGYKVITWSGSEEHFRAARTNGIPASAFQFVYSLGIQNNMITSHKCTVDVK